MDAQTTLSSTQTEFKWLAVIFQNILHNQQIEKYRNLNFNRTCKALGAKCSTHLIWLYNAGFHRSSDDKRLLFDTNKLNELKEVYASLLLIIGDNDNHQNQFLSKPQKSTSHNCGKEYDNTANALQYLKKTMMSTNINQVNMDKLLQSYLYLLHNYNDETQFEHIYHELGGKCDSKACIRLKRNKRNRSNTTNNLKTLYGKTREPFDMVKHDLIDKIHCYYQHTFDAGYSLNKSERNLLTQFEENDVKNECNEEDGIFVNRKILMMNKIISAKRKYFANNDSICMFGQKYNQCEPEMDDKKTYSFGQQFKYSKHHWHDEKFVKFKQRIEVKPVFQSLKEEMMLNGLCNLKIEQFNNEHIKANIHFRSTHCRKIMKPLYDIHKLWKLESKHLLALMIYCNYDMLQNCFSKTYRQNVEDHSRFYYFGFYLKVAIHNFGTPNALGGRNKKFYHGISSKYYFPAYSECYIFGPLSTSISFAVALNFTNANQGMVVQLVDNTTSYASTLYFDVSWLSDFANEKEHLFLQNSYGMRIVNIINAMNGTEYWTILDSLQIFSDIMNLKAKKIYDTVDQDIFNLIYLIVKHQLGKYLPQQYKRFESL
eukprot:312203_1